MRKTITLLILVTLAFLVNACGFFGEEGTLLEEDYYTIVEFSEPVSAREVFELVSDQNKKEVSFKIIMRYDNYQAGRFIGNNNSQEQFNKFIYKQIEVLNFFISNFDSNDEMEKPIFDGLTKIVTEIKSTKDVLIISLEGVNIHVENLKKHPKFKSYSTVSVNNENRKKEKELNKITIAKQAIIVDYPTKKYPKPDESYMPIAGTSTIWSSGSLQKFWFDELSLDYYTNISHGIEMETNITPRYSVTCSGSWDAWLPFKYRDTEAFDKPWGPRNCAVGSLRADLLNVNELYWTWIDFDRFYSWRNPHFDIKFQFSTWCWWIEDFNECMADPDWCMCAKPDESIQWVISYNYNDAPGIEISWNRN